MKKLILAILINLICQHIFAQGFTINGYVKDASSGETLIGATVVIKGTTQGTVTNAYGFYSITLPEGTYDLEYRYIGFNTVGHSVELSFNQRIDIELPIESHQLEEIVITGEPEDINVSGIQMSTNNLDIETIRKVPTLLGEADVLKSLQMLPGVSTVGEGASGFNVRGGSVGQNMVLLDEAPVYNSSHLFGFFSVFNPDAVKDVKLIKGGIPARYGGRIASVLDIRMKEGNNKRFAAQGGIGTIFSRFAIEALIVKDKASFIIAARRSYIDVFAKIFTDVLDEGAALNFYDLTLKTNYNINKRNRIYLSGYFGRDNFKFDAQQGFNWGNKTATFRWNHIFNDRLFANFTFFFSDYDYVLAFGNTTEDQFDWNSRIFNYDFKPEFTYYINPRNELSFGGELLIYRFEPANATGVSNGETQVLNLDEKYAVETAVYVSNDQKIGERWQFQYGMRFSYFSLVGPGTTYKFGIAAEVGDRRPVTDTLSFDNGEKIASYGNLEPRLSVKYQLDAKNSLKFSYNRTSQYIHLISNTTASNPLDVWTPSSQNIKPQTGNQVAMGWFRNFGNNDYEASIETYYRRTTDQIDYIDGADLLLNEFLEGDLLSGKGRAYGLELFVKKNTGKFTGWVSYTMARTELNVEGINNDAWYPTRYDQAHNLKVAAFYEVGSRWSFSANFTFLTGTPTTFPTSRYQVQNYVIPFSFENKRNNFRVPVYHRLDLSATLEGKNKSGKYESYWVFSVYNAYGRKNPFSIYFTQGDTRPAAGDLIDTQARQVSIVGSIIPAISYNFKF